MDFVISDTHFCHTAIIKHRKRPFKDTQEMNETMIKNWNRVVSPKDTVHHGGDIAFRGSHNKMYEIIMSLNGKIKLVIGDHDKDFLRMLKKKDTKGKIEVMGYMEFIRFNHEKIILSHWAMASWNRSHYNSLHIHGHHHGKYHGVGKSIDISVESVYVNYTPVSIIDIIKIMKKRPNNWNYLYKTKE